MIKLSVIIPVYNVEKYIRSCVECVYRQGLDETEFEVILINDGTEDDSFQKIEDIVICHSNIAVIEQENKGLSVARNTGLLMARGQYVLFLDSDDLLIDCSLNCILDMAIGASADLVIADFMKMSDDEIGSMTIKDNREVIVENKSGIDVFLHDLNPQQCYVWRTLYKKSFLNKNNLRFIPDIYFEDIPFTTECYLKADNCIVTNFRFYIYRQRSDSIVSTINMKKLIDMNKIIEYLWVMKSDMTFTPDVGKKMMNVIFVTFSIAIWYLSHDKKLLGKRKQYVLDLKYRVPELQFTNGIKQKLVSLFFKLFPYTYIRLRSYL